MPREVPQIAVLFLHGLCSEAAELSGLLRILADRGVLALAPDQPGWGKSPGPKGLITLRTHLQTAQAGVTWLRQQSKDVTIVLVGHSFGAHGALQAASITTLCPRMVVIIGAPRYSGEGLSFLKRNTMRLTGRVLSFMEPLMPSLKIDCGLTFDGAPCHMDIRTLFYASRMNNILAAAKVPENVRGLVVRGARDIQVAPGADRDLLQAMGSRIKRRITIPGAEHSPFSGKAAEMLAKSLMEIG